MKYLGFYLKEKYGTIDIFQIELSDDEYLKLIAWTEVLREESKLYPIL